MTTTAPLAEGSTFVAKQMQALSEKSFPRHKASTESVLVVTEGRCTVRFSDSHQVLDAGETVIIPANEWHEVEANPTFTAVHIMPHDIKFTFSVSS